VLKTGSARRKTAQDEVACELARGPYHAGRSATGFSRGQRPLRPSRGPPGARGAGALNLKTPVAASIVRKMYPFDTVAASGPPRPPPAPTRPIRVAERRSARSA